MKLKAFLLALVVAGASASFALADDGHGKDRGKGGPEHAAATTTPAKPAPPQKCRPSIELELRGTVASAPSAGALALLVAKGGPDGAALAGKQLTLDVTAAKGAAALKAGATVQVHARACVDLVAGTVTLVATQVEAKRGEGGPTTSTVTTTTVSSSTTTSTTAK